MGKTTLDCTSTAFAGVSADFLQSGYALRFTAQGASMHPLVRDCDVLLVNPVNPAKIRVGDVVLCSNEQGRALVHRVIQKRATADGTGFLVQGDQVKRPDGWIPQTSVLGRVDLVERAGEQMNMHTSAMRCLGLFAVLRSRWGFGRARGTGFFRQIVVRMPIFSKYLL